MREVFKGEVLTIVTDPMDQMRATREAIMEACGMLPQFVLSKLGNRAATMRDHMAESYGFGPLSEVTGGTITEDLVYKYPEDPDLIPYIHMFLEGGEEEFVQWAHGICAMRDSKDAPWFVTRMD